MQKSNAHVATVIGDGTAQLSATSFQLVQLGLNCSYDIWVTGLSLKNYNATDFSSAMIDVSKPESSEERYRGALLSFKKERLEDGDFKYSIQYGSRLHALKEGGGHRIFIEQSAENIIRSILSSYLIKAEFKLEKSNQPISYLYQGEQTDYEFLKSLCANLGIVYFSRQTKTDEILVFSASFFSEKKHVLTFNPSHGISFSPGEIQSVEVFQADLPCLISSESPQVKAKQWLKIIVSGVYLQPGEQVTISNHSFIKSTNAFRVVEVYKQYTGESRGVQYQTLAYLIPASYQYRASKNPSTVTKLNGYESKLPACFYETILSALPSIEYGVTLGQSMGVTIDRRGQYEVRPLLSNPIQERLQNTLEMPLLQMASFDQGQGMHFPILSNTTVLVAQPSEFNSNPFLLGGLPNQSKPCVVTKDNPSHAVLRHLSGGGIQFEETSSVQKTLIHTKDSAYRFELLKNAEIEAVSLVSAGNMGVEAGANFTLSTAYDWTIESHSSDFKAKDTLSFCILKDVRLNGQALILNGQHGWRLQSVAKACTFYNLQGGHIFSKSIELQARIMRINAKFAQVYAQSVFHAYGSKQLSFCLGQQNALKMSSGTISFRAPMIFLKASQLIKNQGGLGVVNLYL